MKHPNSFKTLTVTSASALIMALVSTSFTSAASAQSWDPNGGSVITIDELNKPIPVASRKKRKSKNRRKRRAAAVIGGAIGLAAGAIIANEFARKNQRSYPEPVYVPQRPRYEPNYTYNQPTYRNDRRNWRRDRYSEYPIQPRRPRFKQRRVHRDWQPAPRGSNQWIGSNAWLDYCTQKYRSFNPRTGKFLSYSGYYKLCR